MKRPDKRFTSPDLHHCKLTDGFWKKRQKLVREVVLPLQWKALNDLIPGVQPSGAIRNFRIAAGESQGSFYGRPFQDSDVYKWLEAVAYCLEDCPDSELEHQVDEVIALIGRAQQPDGYLDTLYICGGRNDLRWTNLRDMHELYCAGHLMEAAVAYACATGKDTLLQIACRLADHICDTFGRAEGQKHGYPGHEEVELALVKLYRCTGNIRYLHQASYFVDERGHKPLYFDIEAELRGEAKPYGPTGGKYTYEYNQSHIPIRQQKAAVGHAVRALYYYCAALDVAADTNDLELLNVLDTLWEDVTKKQMYVTGTVGASQFGEAFTIPYDLPPNAAYSETCASVGMMMWAGRRLMLEPEGECADILERTLYNGLLPSMSYDGTRYFYVNPLELWPDAVHARNDLSRTDVERQGWFSCSCCPPNLARTLANLGRYIYSANGQDIYVHLYINSDATMLLDQGEVTISQHSNYPWDATIELHIETSAPISFALCLHVPGWCHGIWQMTVNDEKCEATVNKGYVHVQRQWKNGDRIVLKMPMEVQRIYPSPLIRAVAGRVALQRGPLVYCMEEVDNGPCLSDLRLDKGEIRAVFDADLLDGMMVLEVPVTRSLIKKNSLYDFEPAPRFHLTARFIPYYAWNNRSIGEMSVYIRNE